MEARALTAPACGRTDWPRGRSLSATGPSSRPRLTVKMAPSTAPTSATRHEGSVDTIDSGVSPGIGSSCCTSLRSRDDALHSTRRRQHCGLRAGLPEADDGLEWPPPPPLAPSSACSPRGSPPTTSTEYSRGRLAAVAKALKTAGVIGREPPASSASAPSRRVTDRIEIAETIASLYRRHSCSRRTCQRLGTQRGPSQRAFTEALSEGHDQRRPTRTAPSHDHVYTMPSAPPVLNAASSAAHASAVMGAR